MEENKQNDISEEALITDALYADISKKTEQIEEPCTDTVDIEASDHSKAEKAEATEEAISSIPHDDTESGSSEASPSAVADINADQEKKADNKHKKKSRATRTEKAPRAPTAPITEPALPLLLCMVTFSICFITLIIDRFIYPIGKELLSPVILQIIALIIPSYLVILLTSADKAPIKQMREVGFRVMNAEHVFFTLFSALFAMCASITITLLFGGAYDLSNGITLLGTFTAGKNEYTVSAPYLILTYALIPAFAEEIFFRGVVFSRLSKLGFPFAALVSTLFYALYGFTVGGFIPSVFVGLMTVFLLYTTKSLFSCIILHFLFNLYRLFLEANICAYFISSQNNFLLFISIAIALSISALLFFSEGTKLYRIRAERISNKEIKSANKFKSIHLVGELTRATVAYRPSLAFAIISLLLFIATVVINYIV